MPRAEAGREAYARTTGEDGFALLDLSDQPGTPKELRRLPRLEVPRQVWARHFVREPAGPSLGGGSVRLRGKGDPSTPAVASPYDAEARYRGRHATVWVGYVVHLSETCEDDALHLITHTMTTDAAVHEVRCTAAIQRALAGKGPPPSEHLVDAAYVDAQLLVRSREELGVGLVGPARVDASWQAKLGGGYGLERFEVDWKRERVRCPQGELSSAWSPSVERTGSSYIRVLFRKADCGTCPAQALCTRAKHQARYLKLQPQAEYEGLKAGRERLAAEGGRRLRARRAGIEGTISRDVRGFGLRRSRYRGLAKTHLQHVATAAAINLERLAAWIRAIPPAATRTSRFAALAV